MLIPNALKHSIINFLFHQNTTQFFSNFPKLTQKNFLPFLNFPKIPKKSCQKNRDSKKHLTKVMFFRTFYRHNFSTTNIPQIKFLHIFHKQKPPKSSHHFSQFLHNFIHTFSINQLTKPQIIHKKFPIYTITLSPNLNLLKMPLKHQKYQISKSHFFALFKNPKDSKNTISNKNIHKSTIKNINSTFYYK